MNYIEETITQIRELKQIQDKYKDNPYQQMVIAEAIKEAEQAISNLQDDEDDYDGNTVVSLWKVNNKLDDMIQFLKNH